MFSIHSPPKELHIKFQHSSMSEVLFIIGGHNVPPPRANRYSQTLGLVGLSGGLVVFSWLILRLYTVIQSTTMS